LEEYKQRLLEELHFSWCLVGYRKRLKKRRKQTEDRNGYSRHSSTRDSVERRGNKWTFVPDTVNNNVTSANNNHNTMSNNNINNNNKEETGPTKMKKRKKSEKKMARTKRRRNGNKKKESRE